MKLPFRYKLNRLRTWLVIGWYRLTGPPRILRFSSPLNKAILRAFGARVGRDCCVFSPITLHNCKGTYRNLAIGDGCVLNGNHFLDISAPITLERGVSLGPGVIIMTHNGYNHNVFLEKALSHTIGFKPVLIREGAGIKAGALITMGVVIGRNAVVAGNAVINRDVPDNNFVAGVPARLVKALN